MLVRAQASSVVLPTGMTASRRRKSCRIPKQDSIWSLAGSGQPRVPAKNSRWPAAAADVAVISVAGCPSTVILTTWESVTPWLVSPRRYLR